MKTAWTIVLAVVVGVTAPLFAQKLSQTVQVTYVEVPVTVVDRGGNAVTNLTKDSFELFDEGQRVTISSFDRIDFDQLTTRGPSAGPLPPAATRNFLIIFDLTNSTPGTIDRARDAAKDFVQGQLKPMDRAGVGTYSVDHGFRLAASFTTDRKLLVAAIDTLGKPEYFKVADPLFMSAEVPTTGSGASAAPGAESRSEAAAAIQDTAADFNRMTSQTNDSYLRQRLRAELQGFAAVARALDSVRGQKQIILLSEGFDPRLVQGQATTTAGSQADSEAVLRGEIWKVDSDQRYGNVSSSTDVSDMAKMFRRSDVVMHAIDIAGLRSSVDAREGAKTKSNDGLFLITEPTGGSVFKNSNDLDANFDTLLKQQHVIYVLGFQADLTGSAGKFHDLKVKVKGTPRGTRISARAGYYEPGPSSILERVLSTSEILINDIAYNDVPFSMMTAAFPEGNGRAQVPVELEIDGSKLMEGVSGNTLNGELYVYAFGPDNQVEDYVFQRIAMDLSKVSDTLAKSGVRYYGTLSLAPGNYAIKALLKINESGYLSFKRDNITVPDFKGATVLPPFLWTDAGDWIMLRGNSQRAANTQYPFSVGGSTFIPATEATVNRNAKYKVALFTYNVDPEGLGLGAMVRDAKGDIKPAKVNLLGRTPLAKDGSMQLLFEFTPSDMAAGDWNLEFTLSPKDGEARTVRMPVVVK